MTSVDTMLVYYEFHLKFEKLSYFIAENNVMHPFFDYKITAKQKD